VQLPQPFVALTEIFCGASLIGSPAIGARARRGLTLEQLDSRSQFLNFGL
jgi:hypothetical protein